MQFVRTVQRNASRRRDLTTLIRKDTAKARRLAINRLKLELYLGNEFVPDILSEGLLLWTSLTVLGYVQWFVLLPFISRGIRQLCGAYAARRAAPR